MNKIGCTQAGTLLIEMSATEWARIGPQADADEAKTLAENDLSTWSLEMRIGLMALPLQFARTRNLLLRAAEVLDTEWDRDQQAYVNVEPYIWRPFVFTYRHRLLSFLEWLTVLRIGVLDVEVSSIPQFGARALQDLHTAAEQYLSQTCEALQS